MRFGIIGCGEISKKHIQAIEDVGGDLVAACDINPLKLAPFKGKQLYTNWVNMLNGAELDVVVIATPNYLHVPMAITSLNMGARVIVEKPVAVSSTQLVELLEHPLVNNVAVCYQRRFNKQCAQISEYCRNHDPIYAFANILVRRDPPYWNIWRSDYTKSGGGNLMNIDIHYLDLLQWWMKGDIYVKSASIYQQNTIDKSVLAEVQFGRVPAHILGTTLHTKRDITMGVHFADGTTLVYDTDDATHTDVYREFLKNHNYVTVEEAAVSLKIVEEIYEKAQYR